MLLTDLVLNVLATFSGYLQRNIVVETDCKLLPHDENWPKQEAWDAFNRSIDGRLIKTLPVGAPCHVGGQYGSFDAEKCKYVQEHWHQADLHLEHPSSVMDSIFLNKSCDPFTSKEDKCSVGSYVQYAINVSEPEHIHKTIKFVTKHNIRFVVKNTGHDYMGRSTGAGAVSVWMHHLQNLTWFDNYTSPAYSGPAIKVQAGAMGYQINKEASKRGMVVVVGECPTVGFAGGYIQGGGHSFLSSKYGLAADQTLSFEVITADGRFITASPEENQDLYWALSGGGGGYGVVWSVTVKAFPDRGATIAYLSFKSEGLSSDQWWSILSAWHRLTPTLTDIFMTTSYNSAGFAFAPLFAPAVPVENVMGLLQPFLSLLDCESIKYNFSIEYYPRTPSTFENGEAQFVMGYQMGGRLLPKSLWQNNRTFDDFMNTVRRILEDGASFIWDVKVSPTMKAARYPDNAVHPAWRDAERMFNPVIMISDHDSTETILSNQKQITQIFDEQLKRLTPDGGAYLNEADPAEPDWKKSFYGSNYDRLLSIKDKYDSQGILYSSISVGGDYWREMEDGRICRSKKLK